MRKIFANNKNVNFNKVIKHGKVIINDPKMKLRQKNNNIWNFIVLERYGRTAHDLKSVLKDRPDYALQIGIQLVE